MNTAIFKRWLGLFVAVAGLVLLAAACGGESSSTHSASGPSSAGTSAEFLRLHSPTNKFVNFGTEASAREREAASKVLGENLKAREEGNFAMQCASLNRTTSAEITGSEKTSVVKDTCPKALGKLAEPLKSTQDIRTDNLVGGIAVLRVRGAKAYALFHGKNKKDYAFPMEKEAAGWKVAALLETEIADSRKRPS
jgi:hypothetical protein